MSPDYTRFGLTAREKAIWPPKKNPLQEASEYFFETLIVGTFVILFMIFVACAVFWFHMAHADEDMTYCQAWANGAQVTGADDGEIAEYCSQYAS